MILEYLHSASKFFTHVFGKDNPLLVLFDSVASGVISTVCCLGEWDLTMLNALDIFESLTIS